MKRTGIDDVTEQIPKGVHYLNSFYNKAMAEWPWRYRSRSKAIKCKTPSNASNHLWKIKIQSIQKLCRLQSRHDKICYISAFFSKVRQEWHIHQGQKSLHMTHPLMLVVIWAKYKKKSIQDCMCATKQTWWILDWWRDKLMHKQMDREIPVTSIYDGGTVIYGTVEWPIPNIPVSQWFFP